MKLMPPLQDLYTYFRMALVTGILDKESVISWADRQLLRDPDCDYELIELSLAGSQPYSQIIWLLNSFGSGRSYDLPLKLLFARAGVVLEREPGRAKEIIMGLRLVNEEEYLPAEIRHSLVVMDQQLETYLSGEIGYDELSAGLTSFLESYNGYRSLLEELV